MIQLKNWLNLTPIIFFANPKTKMTASPYNKENFL